MSTPHTLAIGLQLILASLSSVIYAADDSFPSQRLQMIELIREDVSRTSLYLDKEALDQRVLQVMGEIPRHRFVPLSLRDQAYENRPLPIGHGQTISQPYIVAIMTDLVAPQATDKALEIGTGSGYQAAVLSRLVSKVFSMEVIEPLGEQAKERLQKLGYDNIETDIADGYFGWQTQAPFDIIIVTAAASHVPPPLVKQIKPGGRMIIPVGSRFMTQQLLLISKDLQEKITIKQILPVRFVPLTGDH
ncbi:MAG: protein-L-isoaspartate(D-aspartate) O-methyltransferase [Candidatus Thiodiazotropha sp. (ex Myrtea spinifera)]|nr:protein-L-isoaspartate(D-aspartate) O-methyltransferase [Candidatus Thiodiazotropha sp. (ex Myrtea spinifera)]MCU7830696.1 protein-L-isoaspartate(D-aspartate) O-methyltransferase [Candidatus Thiodiazotropha sp. (ex Myrtea sp. 'scaly one' KF741663)]